VGRDARSSRSDLGWVEIEIFLQRGLDTNLPDGQITALKALRDLRARAKITQRIDRLELGNPGDLAPVGEGVSEMRINYGPGLSSLYQAARCRIRCSALWRRQEHTSSRHKPGQEISE